jgi:hypothetical protein
MNYPVSKHADGAVHMLHFHYFLNNRDYPHFHIAFLESGSVTLSMLSVCRFNFMVTE